MRRWEREAMERRWRVECRRSVPSASAVFRYLERFHDHAEESKREPGRTFIPAATAGLRGLNRVNADMVAFVQRHIRQTRATLDMDATLVETHKQQAQYCYEKYKAHQPLTTYWHEADLIVHTEFQGRQRTCRLPAEAGVPTNAGPIAEGCEEGDAQVGHGGVPAGVAAVPVPRSRTHASGRSSSRWEW